MIRKITTYCASSAKVDAVYLDEAYNAGRLMAEMGIALVNGAGNMGLMRAGADGCMEAGGRAVGIIPRFMIDEGWCYESMSKIIESSYINYTQRMMGEDGEGGRDVGRPFLRHGVA